MCQYCYENTHSDYDHAHLVDNDPEREGCWICEGRPATRVEAFNDMVKAPEIASKGWNSHAGHNHPKTAAARAACRKASRELS